MLYRLSRATLVAVSLIITASSARGLFILHPSSFILQEDATAHFNKAIALYRAAKVDGKLDAALEEFRVAEKAAPRDPSIQGWIGFILLLQEKYAEAVTPLEQAIQLRPANSATYTKERLAETYTNLG